MDSDRPGGDASRPGDLPSDFGEWTAEQPPACASPPDQPAAAAGDVASSDQHPRFTVGGSFADAATRIGGALGSAHRGSHGLQVVHGAERSPLAKPSEEPCGNDHSPPENEIAARMMHEIEEAVAELRRHAAGRLISLQKPDEPPAEERLTRVDPCGLVYKLFFRIQQRMRRLSTEKPLQTAAAVIALGLAFGAALRLRK